MAELQASLCAHTHARALCTPCECDAGWLLAAPVAVAVAAVLVASLLRLAVVWPCMYGDCAGATLTAVSPRRCVATPVAVYSSSTRLQWTAKTGRCTSPTR